MNEASAPLLAVSHLSKFFPVTRGLMRRTVAQVKAVDDVSFTVARGETLALVGESGSGKTTLGRALLHIDPPTAGTVTLDGTRLDTIRERDFLPVRRRLQMIFQDPFSSLNPRMRIRSILAEPLAVHGLVPDAAARDARINSLLDMVGLPANAGARFPHEFSGGQRQRIGIARALAVEPDLIVADEPVSALDVSIQAQILSLMVDLRERLNLTYLFIGHDLAVIRYIATRVAVMYLGRIVEVTDRDTLFERPAHPYTVSLLSAAPIPDPVAEARRRRLPLPGDIPSPISRPSGCAFHPRCPLAIDRCRVEPPSLSDIAPGQSVACWRPGEAQELLRQ
jgi:oligopeptide transport system ATP-binding protein